MISSPQDDFNTDIDKLKAAAQAYADAQAAEEAAEKTYREVILAKLDSLKSAEEILVYLQLYVFESSTPSSDPTSDACVFGIYGDKMNTQGKALQVNSYLTAVHNDLQKLVTSDDSDPNTVKDVATDLNQILDELKKDPNLKAAMDPSSYTNMMSTDTTLRHEFYIEGDTSGYNPDKNADPSKGYTYHFYNGSDATQQGLYLTSFKEMEDNMKLPADGKQATEAYKAQTDNLNSDSSMTQTVNSALNVQINQLSNFIKQVEGFYENAILQPSMKLINQVISNTK